MEIWKDVPGYVGLYQISNYGRVKSVFRNEICGNMNRKRNEKILKPSLRKRYYFVSLSKNGIKYNAVIHRLVAAAFIPNPDNKPCVDHIDGVRFHNFVENLRWCSINENNNFDIAIRNKTKYDFPIEGIDENGNVCIEFQNYKDAHKKGYYRHLIKQSVDTGKPYKGIIYRKK